MVNPQLVSEFQQLLVFGFTQVGSTGCGTGTTMGIILVDCVAFMNIFRMPATRPHSPVGHTKRFSLTSQLWTRILYIQIQIKCLYSRNMHAVCMSLSLWNWSFRVYSIFTFPISHFHAVISYIVHATCNMSLHLLLLLFRLLLLLYGMLLSSNTKCPLNVSDHTWLLACLSLPLSLYVPVSDTIDWKNINITVSSVSLYAGVCARVWECVPSCLLSCQIDGNVHRLRLNKHILWVHTLIVIWEDYWIIEFRWDPDIIRTTYIQFVSKRCSNII